MELVSAGFVRGETSVALALGRTSLYVLQKSAEVDYIYHDGTDPDGASATA